MLPKGRSPPCSGDAVQARAHPVLAHAPVNGAAGRMLGPKLPPCFSVVPVLPPRSAEPPTRLGTGGGSACRASPRRLPRGQRLVSPARAPAGPGPSPAEARPRATARARAANSGNSRGVRCERVCASRSRARAPRPTAARQCSRASSRNVELRLRRPAEDLLGAAGPRRRPAERRAPRRCSRLVGAGSAMWCAARSASGGPSRPRPAASAASIASRSLPSPSVQHVPAVGLEAPADVLGERELGVAVDGDVVVVVDDDQPAQPEVAGERRRLVATPSIRSPSLANTQVWWSTIAWSGR